VIDIERIGFRRAQPACPVKFLILRCCSSLKEPARAPLAPFWTVFSCPAVFNRTLEYQSVQRFPAGAAQSSEPLSRLIVRRRPVPRVRPLLCCSSGVSDGRRPERSETLTASNASSLGRVNCQPLRQRHWCLLRKPSTTCVPFSCPSRTSEAREAALNFDNRHYPACAKPKKKTRISRQQRTAATPESTVYMVGQPTMNTARKRAAGPSRCSGDHGCSACPPSRQPHLAVQLCRTEIRIR